MLIQCWHSCSLGASVIGGLNNCDVCEESYVCKVSYLLDSQLTDVPPACGMFVATCALEADLPPHTSAQVTCPGVPIRCFESDAHCRNTVQNRRNQPEKSSNGLPGDILALPAENWPVHKTRQKLMRLRYHAGRSRGPPRHAEWRLHSQCSPHHPHGRPPLRTIHHHHHHACCSAVILLQWTQALVVLIVL